MPIYAMALANGVVINQNVMSDAMAAEIAAALPNGMTLHKACATDQWIAGGGPYPGIGWSVDPVNKVFVSPMDATVKIPILDVAVATADTATATDIASAAAKS